MRSRIPVWVLAAALPGCKIVLLRLPQRWKPWPQLAFGILTVVLTRAPLGLRPPHIWSGLRWGLAAAAPVVLAVGASTAIPRVRAGMADRDLPPSPLRWILVDIPLGTAVPEELAYRGALGAAASAAFGATRGRAVSATVFGLSHVPDARAAGDSVPGTVLLTAAAGWVLSWLAGRSRSLLAAVLAHLVVNEAGAVAALAVRGARVRGAGPRPAERPRL